LQVLAKGGLSFGTAEYTEEKGRVLPWLGRSVSKLISSWRGLSLLFSVLPWKNGVRDNRTNVVSCAYAHNTTGVLFFAGMKGNPFGGVLFNHVPFFRRGELSKKRAERQGSFSTSFWF
jgi:hypothetical protein